MITYLDMTFCASPNCQNKCNRQLTQTIEKGALVEKAPLSLAFFCDEEGNLIGDAE